MADILIIDIHYPPELTGVARYTGQFAAHLAARGHRVRVVTAYPSYPLWRIFPEYRSRRFWYSTETSEGVEIIRCPLWVPQRPGGLTRIIYTALFGLTSTLAAIAATLQRKPDLILGVVPTLPSLAWLALAPTKTWIHIQDFEVEAALGLGMMPAFLKNTLLWLEKSIYARVNLVSTISGKMIEGLRQKGLDSSHTFLFPNWVDTETIHPQPASRLRESLSIPPTLTTVLYAGNFGKKQGLDLLLDAANLLQNDPTIQFILCGDGADAHLVRQRAAVLPNVLLLPLQPPAALNDLLALADIHALPQRADVSDLVLPSKLSGMLASGRAVVASAYPETELGHIIQKVGLLVPPGNAQAFAAAIGALAGDPARRAALGAAGRNWVVEHWSQERIFTTALRRMDELLG